MQNIILQNKLWQYILHEETLKSYFPTMCLMRVVHNGLCANCSVSSESSAIDRINSNDVSVTSGLVVWTRM